MNGKKLKSLRKSKLLTQEQAAEIFNVSIHTYRSWEWEKKEPRLQKIKEIVKYFECTADELI